MNGYYFLRKKSAIALIIFLSFWSIFSILENVDPLYAVVMALWGLMFSYSLVNMDNHPMAFCFLSSFFVFLLGRQLCFHYLHMEQVYAFLDVTNAYTYTCLILSFLGLGTGMFFGSGRLCFQLGPVRRRSFTENGQYNNNYRQACRYVFFVCYIGTVFATLLQILYVIRVGYLGSYTQTSGGAGIPGFFSYMTRSMPISLCLYLASMPSKQEAAIPLALYELYAVMMLFTGQRYPFVGISMFILVYCVLRTKAGGKWVLGRHYIMMAAMVPVLILFLTAYDALRVHNAFSTTGFSGTLTDFLIQQGGSINTIRRVIYNAEQLKDMKLVSFSGMYSVLFENTVIRRLLDVVTYGGNSLGRAFHTNLLAHRLSWIAYGTGYLEGKGTGSSYIAELLHDFGIIGVLLGNVIYGFIIGRIDEIRFEDQFYDGIKLALIYHILLAPRGSFDSLISNVFNLYTAVGFIFVLFMTRLFSNRI